MHDIDLSANLSIDLIETKMIPNEAQIIQQARLLDHDTPYFFTSKEILQHNYSSFTKIFDNEEVYYAIKANADPKILTFLNSLGSGFEAASKYEIDALLSAGVSPHKIIYGTSVKPSSHIEHAIKNGVNRFAADSKEEIDKLAKYTPGAKVLIRVAVNDIDSVFAFSERFGAAANTVTELVLYAKNLGLKTYGLSFHVGSQATHVEHWANAIFSIKPIIIELYEQGVVFEVIDIGGGFPVTYNNHKKVPHLQEIVAKLHNALHTLPYAPKIIMEPGRGIIASATVMVSEVISRTIRNGKVWLVLDGGIYNGLYEAMIHQGTTQYDVHSAAEADVDVELMPCVLAGPTGDSLDIITRDISLPSFITVGDRLIFENAGAYTVTMASPFNGFPKPELYLG